ncbi:MAG: sugar phosphate isomerase/epimerase [Oscillospiraceae bacterium]|nr:sugar phosphate isomerase/epimerase [Oscillospiraceae bacterium]
MTYTDPITKTNKNKILCSTGTMIGRLNDFDYTLIPVFAKNIDCDGYEFMMEPFWNDEQKTAEITEFLCPLKINFATFHMDKNIGDMISKNGPGDIEEALRIFELNCAAAKKLGAGLLVLHLWGGLESDKNIGKNIEVCATFLEIAGKFGLTLTVENVVCNTQNAIIHMEKLYETYGKSIKFTIDVRHAEFHKLLKATCEADFLWENGLVPHFHIADYKGDYMDWSKIRPVLPPGEGEVDFPYLSAFLKKTGYKGSFTLEASGAMTDAGLNFDILKRRLDFIRDLMR